MDVSKYQFGKDEIEKLRIFRDNQNNPRLKLRFVALLILAEGLESQKVASIMRKSEKTIENWVRQYRAKGIESLNSFQYKPKMSFLNEEQVEKLINWVKETNPKNIKQIKEYVRQQFNVNYSNEGVRKLLKKKQFEIFEA